MPIALNPDLNVKHFEEGSAFFNRFSGDTLFVSAEITSLIKIVEQQNCHQDELLAAYADTLEQPASICQEQFQQFITEALNSGMLISV